MLKPERRATSPIVSGGLEHPPSALLATDREATAAPAAAVAVGLALAGEGQLGKLSVWNLLIPRGPHAGLHHDAPFPVATGGRQPMSRLGT